jgi:16S rRNA (uracil1498-N3)-methyltransferase
LVERTDRAPVSTFYAPGAWAGDGIVALGEGAAHHASVKRLAVGDPVRLTSGDGRRASGEIAALGKRALSIAIAGEAEIVASPPSIELWAPVGDRDRMLWLAEKAVELGLSSWRPVVYHRSRSVSPRGEGESFRDKVRLRMISALEQSGGAWLPALHAEVTQEQALQAAPCAGVLLDGAGAPLAALAISHAAPILVALGPEGGLESDERTRFAEAGWRAASLGSNVLRFETAAITALAVLHSRPG